MRFLFLFSFFFGIALACNSQEKVQGDLSAKLISSEWERKIKTELNESLDYFVFDSLCRYGIMDQALLMFKGFNLDNVSIEKRLFLTNKLTRSYCLRYQARGFDADISLEESYKWAKIAYSYIDSLEDKNSKNVADAYEGIGLAYYYYRPSELDSALFYLSKAYNIYSEIMVPQDIKIYQSLINIGDAYRWQRFDYLKAEKYYRESLKLLEQADFNKRADMFVYPMYCLASTYRRMGDLKLGIDYYYQAIEEIPKLYSENLIEYWNGICYTGLANIYKDDGDLEKALAIYLEVRELYPEDPVLNNNLASCFLVMNQPDIAEYIAETALKHALIKDQRQAGLSYEILGKIKMDNSEFDQAREYFIKCKEARDKYYTGYKHLHKVDCLQNLANLCLLEANPEEALIWAQKAVIQGSTDFNDYDYFSNPDSNHVVSPIYLLDPLRTKAEAFRELYINSGDLSYLNGSLECIIKCDSLIDRSRQSFLVEESTLSLQERVYSTYIRGVENAFDLYSITDDKVYLDIGFRFFEQNKYRNILDRINSQKALIDENVSDELINEIRAVQQLRNKYNDSLLRFPHIPYYADSVSHSSTRLNKLRYRLENEYPNYFQAKMGHKHLTIEDLQDSLNGTGALICQYFCTDDFIYSIILGNSESKFVRIEKDSGFTSCLNVYTNTMESFNSDLDSYKEFVICSKYLYNKLLGDHIGGFENERFEKIIVIPDNDLSKINFESLVTEMPDTSRVDYQSLNYLIKDYSIFYGFSAETLFSNYFKKPGKKGRILGMGFGEENTSNFSSIKGSKEELKAISKKYNGRFFINEKATKENFLDKAPDYSIVHLALHGMAGSEDGDSTILVFRNRESASGTENLAAYELYHSELKAGLVVLSSCVSGRGREFSGEGIYSMARAFYYAGCPAIISTLWNLNDDAAGSIITSFYSHLAKGNSASASLRLAKLGYIDNAPIQLEAHPALWASFIHQGRFIEFEIKPKPRSTYLSGIALLIVIAVLIIPRLRKVGKK